MSESQELNTSLLDGAFRAASQFSRTMRNWQPSEGSADADLLPSLNTLRARCRDAYRNSPLAKAISDRVVQHAVGTGLKPQISLDREELNYAPDFAASLERKIEKKFERWAKNCDFERMQTFGRLQSLALTSMFLSGDVFVNTVAEETLLIQIIEGDQVTNPSFAPDGIRQRGGVELDDKLRPIAYWMLENHPGELYAQWKWNRIPIFGANTGERRIFQMMMKTRPGEHRGVPSLAVVLESLRLLEKYTDAELMAAVMSACFSVFIKSNAGMATQTNSNTNEKEVYPALKPGLMMNLKDGEEVVFANPTRPNSSYQPFVVSLLQQIGAGLSLPMEFLLQAYNSSYSASRASMLQAWKTILVYRDLVVNQLCNPIFNLWLKWSEIPEEIHEHISVKWVGPARGTIDEYKEVLAAKERIALGLSSRAEECEELRGVDWLDVNRQLATEERQRLMDGLPAMVQTPPQENFLKDEKDDTANNQQQNATA